MIFESESWGSRYKVCPKCNFLPNISYANYCGRYGVKLE